MLNKSQFIKQNKDMKLNKALSLLYDALNQNKNVNTCKTCKFWIKSERNPTLMKCAGSNGCELTGENFFCGNWEKQ